MNTPVCENIILNLHSDCCYYCSRLLVNTKKPFHARCKLIHTKIEKLTAKKNEISSVLSALQFEAFLIEKQSD